MTLRPGELRKLIIAYKKETLLVDTKTNYWQCEMWYIQKRNEIQIQSGYLILLMVLSAAKSATRTSSSGHYKFPELFLFGTATASFQVEGGWNTDGKIQYPCMKPPW
jgi:hypothetical protein